MIRRLPGVFRGGTARTGRIVPAGGFSRAKRPFGGMALPGMDAAESRMRVRAPTGGGMRTLAIALVALGSVAASASPVSDPCDKAKRSNGWCAQANAGYIASLEIPSHLLYEALDAHGHDIEPSGMACETCRKALAADGFCPAHKMGFVAGKAYLSRMTYQLARSVRIDAAAIQCPICRKNNQGIGWCDTHRLGIAGNHSWTDRQAYSEFQDSYRLLQAALEMLPRCETCAAAMVADGYCPKHRTKYDGGRAVTPPSP